jgi:acyl carrier protein
MSHLVSRQSTRDSAARVSADTAGVDQLDAADATVEQDVRRFLTLALQDVAKIAPEVIGDGACLDAELTMESVALVEVQVAIEDAYDIEVDAIHVLELNEFAAIVNYICELVHCRTHST